MSIRYAGRKADGGQASATEGFVLGGKESIRVVWHAMRCSAVAGAFIGASLFLALTLSKELSLDLTTSAAAAAVLLTAAVYFRESRALKRIEKSWGASTD